MTNHIPKYGHISYELPRALKLVEDIESNRGLKQGTEQYPNGLCCTESSQHIDKFFQSDAYDSHGFSDECIDCIKELARLLKLAGYTNTIFVKENAQYANANSVWLSDLVYLQEKIMDTMPQIWNQDNNKPKF